ncbi:MAG: cell wall-binding repeat-containing protein [Coriobacteriia bacterium]|nr:cell wall-binding repeat-containing protein [Coriobacteriia bacterium]
MRLALGLLVFLGSTPSLAHAVEKPFFAENGASEATLSEMAIHPASVRIGSVTYIAYQGPGYDPYVASYDEATGAWDGPYRAGTNPLSLDTHGAPSLFVDAAGRLHIIYGGHNRTLLHSRVAQAGAINEWDELPYIDTAGTYPQVMQDSTGRLLLFYRTSAYDWAMRVSNVDRELFGEATIVLEGAPDTWWYADFRQGAGGTVHAAFVWVDNNVRATGVAWGRQNAYYMHRLADGTWTDAARVEVALPLDHASADTQVRIFDSQARPVNEISVKEDASGAPCVLFLTGEGAGPDAYTWTFARFAEGAWSFSSIAKTDHHFDSGAILPGAGAAIEAVVVVGENGAAGAVGQNQRGRGGRLERFVSSDHGASWSFAERVSPDEPLSAFADPQFVKDGSGRARLTFMEWNNDDTAFFNRMYLWGDDGLVSRDITVTVGRVAGAVRAQTAIEISKVGFPEGARTVVIATERDYPDALTGVPLASHLSAPLLLTAADGLSPGLAEEISRLGAKTAVLLGGRTALTNNIQTELLSRTTVRSVERLEGATRYDTALAISRKMYDPTREATRAVIVSGEGWPDAATAAPLAAALDVPVLLVRRDYLPSQTASALAEWKTTSAIVVGGDSVVSSGVVAGLPMPIRLSGPTRYETAYQVARFGLDEALLPERLLLATGAKFPDAISGASLAARLRAPVLFVTVDEMPPPTRNYLIENRLELTRVIILGATGSVGSSMESRVSKVLDLWRDL